MITQDDLKLALQVERMRLAQIVRKLAEEKLSCSYDTNHVIRKLADALLAYAEEE